MEGQDERDDNKVMDDRKWEAGKVRGGDWKVQTSRRG